MSKTPLDIFFEGKYFKDFNYSDRMSIQRQMDSLKAVFGLMPQLEETNQMIDDKQDEIDRFYKERGKLWE
jgi:hypothetical protein